MPTTTVRSVAEPRTHAAQTSPPPLVLDLEGVPAFRDLGGYPAAGGTVTRSGVLFRSAAPIDLSETARHTLDALGVRTIVDLRCEFELRSMGVVQPPSGARSVRIAPLDAQDAGTYARRLVDVLGDQLDTTALYAVLLREGGAAFARAAATVAGGLPALFCCSGGRHRTGLLAALLLGAVGTPEDAIVGDWATSGATPLARTSTEPIEMALELLRRGWGGSEGYLRTHGVDSGTLDQLRDALVVPARGPASVA